MKTINKNKTTFTPKTLELVFETQKELDAFAKIFNFSPICDLMREHLGGTVPQYNVLQSMGANASVDGMQNYLANHPAMN